MKLNNQKNEAKPMDINQIIAYVKKRCDYYWKLYHEDENLDDYALEKEDLIGEVLEAVVKKALRNYDPSKSRKRYFDEIVGNTLIDIYDKWQRKKRDCIRAVDSGYPDHPDDDTDMEPLIERIPAPEDNQELINDLRRALSRLTERQREVIINRYGLFNNKELTQKEVAELIGVVRQTASSDEEKALKVIRDFLVQ